MSGGNDDDDLIPLKEFARRLGRNVEATRRRFGDIAVERRGRLYFKRADLQRLLTAEKRDDDGDYTVTRTFLSRALDVDPRTVDKRLAGYASRLVKGQRRYRECDMAPILEAARGEELLNEIEVTLLMGGHHFWQLHLLIDFPHVLLRDDDGDYTVTRTFLSRALDVDPRTVDKRLAGHASRLVKGQRCYRECDMAPILEAARGEELLNEIEVTLLMGGHHFWQLHLLIDFPHVLMRDDAQRVPRPDSRGPMGALWMRKTIAPWAGQMRTNAARMLTPKALTLYRAAAAPLEPQNAALLTFRACAPISITCWRIWSASSRTNRRSGRPSAPPSRGCDHFSFFFKR